MNKYRYKLAKLLVKIANFLVNNPNAAHKSSYYRPVNTYMPGIGHEFSCGAYSHESLTSLVEQDGPTGFGATATVKWLIGKEGWKKVEDMEPRELRRSLAMSGIDLEGDLLGELEQQKGNQDVKH